MFVNVLELKEACRTLSLRAVAAGKPGLARRFGLALVHPAEVDPAQWVCQVGDELLEDETTGPLLRRELRIAA